MPFGMPELIGIIVILLLWVAITVGLKRWIFKINIIVDRLDKIIELSEGKQKE